MGQLYAVSSTGPYLVTSQVSMDDRRILQVQVVKSRQYLACPLPDCLELQVSMFLSILSQIARCEEFRDEVDAVVVGVMPTPAATSILVRSRSHLSAAHQGATLSQMHSGLPQVNAHQLEPIAREIHWLLSGARA